MCAILYPKACVRFLCGHVIVGRERVDMRLLWVRKRGQVGQ